MMRPVCAVAFVVGDAKLLLAGASAMACCKSAVFLLRDFGMVF
jgi:hypothetical protein